MKGQETVCAVVVTYNKKEVLLECLKAIRMQTRPIDAICLIDNASTDDTPLSLKDEGYIVELPPEDLKNAWETCSEIKDLVYGTQIKFYYVRVHDNTGGAGGFNEGLTRAMEKGYDWLWLMDDDGMPETNTLEILMRNAKPERVVHPLVVSPNDKNIFSFGCWILEGRKRAFFKTVEELEKEYPRNSTLPSLGTPFNGTLLSRSIVKTCGYPKSELFIWGDETEYINRIHKAGFQSMVITDAIFCHPHNPLIYNIFDSEKNDWWKIYYLLRNKIVILKLFHKFPFAEIKFLKIQLNALLKVLKGERKDLFYKIKIIVIAAVHGLAGRFGKYEIQL